MFDQWDGQEDTQLTRLRLTPGQSVSVYRLAMAASRRRCLICSHSSWPCPGEKDICINDMSVYDPLPSEDVGRPTVFSRREESRWREELGITLHALASQKLRVPSTHHDIGLLYSGFGIIVPLGPTI